MSPEERKVAERDQEIQKRLSTVEIARSVRQKISQAHGTFPEINSWIREIREGLASGHE